MGKSNEKKGEDNNNGDALFHNLPRDMWKLIFSFLQKPSDFFSRVRLTCKFFNTDDFKNSQLRQFFDESLLNNPDKPFPFYILCHTFKVNNWEEIGKETLAAKNIFTTVFDERNPAAAGYFKVYLTLKELLLLPDFKCRDKGRYIANVGFKKEDIESYTRRTVTETKKENNKVEYSYSEITTFINDSYQPRSDLANLSITPTPQ